MVQVANGFGNLGGPSGCESLMSWQRRDAEGSGHCRGMRKGQVVPVRGR